MIVMRQFLTWLSEHVFNGLRWWEQYWLRIHLASTAIGGIVLTFFLSGASLSDVWDTTSEFKAAAGIAPIGVLIYTAFAALLEAGVMAMVLAMAVAGKLIDEFYERQERRKEQEKQQEEREKFLIALGVEAERRRRETGGSLEEIVAQLVAEDWRPPQSE